MVMQGLVWESYKAIFLPSCSSSKEIYHMTRDMPGDERSGEDLDQMTYNMKGQEI